MSSYDDSSSFARQLAEEASRGKNKQKGSPLKKIIGMGVAGVVLFIAIIVLFAGGSLNRVAANEWGCLYGGGLEKRGLKDTIAPGQSGGFTIFDKLATIPSDDRYLFIDKDPNTADIGANEIIVPAQGTSNESQGIVNVNVEIQVRFVINENVCDLYTDKLKRLEPLKFDSSDGTSTGGWGKFIVNQLNQALIKASRPLVAPYNYIELYSNTPVTIDGEEILIYDVMEDGYATDLTKELEATLGATYFCGPTYVFDGDVDGQFDNGCPPIEVTVKRVTPVDGQLITNLETTVKNQEQIKVIESEKQKKLAQTAADQAAQLAEIARQKEVETSEAAKDQAVAVAQKALFLAQNENAQIKAQAETAFCAELAALEIDCADYWEAINWRPTVILSDDTDTNVNLPV